MTPPTSLETARADALLATLQRRRSIRMDAEFFAARRKLGWTVAASNAAAELLADRGCAHFRADGESIALVLGTVDGEVRA